MSTYKILCIESRPLMRNLVSGQEVFGWSWSFFTSVDVALRNIEVPPDLIIIDGGQGIKQDQLLRLRDHFPLAYLLGVLDGNTMASIRLYHDWGMDELVDQQWVHEAWLSGLLKRLAHWFSHYQSLTALRNELAASHHFGNIIGGSPAVLEMIKHLKKAVKSHVAVLLQGEPGVGKEMIARTIHANSTFREGPFVHFSLSGLGSSAFAKELLSNPETQTKKINALRKAAGGTLYLSEVEVLSLQQQNALYLALSEILSTNHTPGTRLIFSSQSDLGHLSESGAFSLPLYQDISQLIVKVPALRERGNDVGILAQHFLTVFSEENNSPKKSFSPVVLQCFLSYDWPGNIRELKSTVELAAVISKKPVIEMDSISIPAAKTFDTHTVISNDKTLREYIADLVQYQLGLHQNNVVETAKKLGVGKSTIYRMIQNGEVKIL
ncbi:MAG: sigma-54-dependent Fis family transcriptional regulator [Cryomorphaceae bacterium]|nr:sigma-54-dependent Fis family transcriptional regulator [Cryomorphaceae bacterium]